MRPVMPDFSLDCARVLMYLPARNSFHLFISPLTLPLVFGFMSGYRLKGRECASCRSNPYKRRYPGWNPLFLSSSGSHPEGIQSRMRRLHVRPDRRCSVFYCVLRKRLHNCRHYDGPAPGGSISCAGLPVLSWYLQK